MGGAIRNTVSKNALNDAVLETLVISFFVIVHQIRRQHVAQQQKSVPIDSTKLLPEHLVAVSVFAKASPGE